MLYIMRHGITDWNAESRLQGRTDVALNEAGEQMAQGAAVEYSNVHFDVCYCSPLLRARKTADLVLEGRNVPIIYDDRLVEMSFGTCEGLANYRKAKSPIKVFFDSPEKYITPVEGGESLSQLFERTGSFLREIIDPLILEEKDVLIVGHGAMNSSIVCQVLNLPVEKFWSKGIQNCELMRLI